MSDFTPPPVDPPRLEGTATRDEATIRHVECETDEHGGFRELFVDLDTETLDSHEQLRITVFDDTAMHYDRILQLAGWRRWIDLARALRDAGAPLPSQGITRAGTQVRVAPFHDGERLQGRVHLALECTLDALQGEGRHVAGHWEAQWPGSLWVAGAVVGVGQVNRAFVIARTGLLDQDMSWSVYAVGGMDTPFVSFGPGEGQARVTWRQGGFVGIDLTDDFRAVRWGDLGDAVFEAQALPRGAGEDARPARLAVPVTAR